MSSTRNRLFWGVAIAWGSVTTSLATENGNAFRTWRDREGNPFQARLINFQPQTSAVTLRSPCGMSGRFPLMNFSPNDQDFIRASFVPRIWTSTDGIKSEPLMYGGMDGTRVRLLPKSGSLLRTEFSNLSPVDQAFLRRIDAEAVPQRTQAADDAPSNSPAPIAGTVPKPAVDADPNPIHAGLVSRYAEPRTWTIDGVALPESRFISRQNGSVLLALPDRAQRAVLKTSLSDEDLDYIREFEARIRALTQEHPWQSAVIRVGTNGQNRVRVQGIYLSSDGRKLAVTYRSEHQRGVHTVRYFDAASGTLLGTHEIPERMRLAVGGSQGFAFLDAEDAIALIDVEQTRGQQTFHTYRVMVLSLGGHVLRISPPIGTTTGGSLTSALKASPDGGQIALAYHVDNAQHRSTSVEVAILDTATLERLHAFKAPVSVNTWRNERPSLAFSPDSRRLAVLYFEQHLAMWDLATDREIPIFQRVSNSHPIIQFDDAGSGLITFGARCASIIDLAGGGTRDLPLPDRSERPLTFSRTQPLFATSGSGADPDCMIVLRELRLHQPVQRLTGHRSTVVQLTFAENGERLASLDEDGTVRVWDITRAH
jgi:WD40 repeat protein